MLNALLGRMRYTSTRPQSAHWWCRDQMRWHKTCSQLYAHRLLIDCFLYVFVTGILMVVSQRDLLLATIANLAVRIVKLAVVLHENLAVDEVIHLHTCCRM